MITLRNIDWTAAILTGGRARRLGGVDKSALVIGGRSILERQLAALRGLTPHVLIVARDDRAPAGEDTRVVADRCPGTGSLGGLYTALVESPTEQIVVIACDMPFLTAPFLARLAEIGTTADAAVPRDARGPHPLCASYHRHLSDGLRRRIDAGRLRVRDALDDVRVHEIGPDELSAFDPDGRLLMNVNTVEDYRDAIAADARRP